MAQTTLSLAWILANAARTGSIAEVWPFFAMVSPSCREGSAGTMEEEGCAQRTTEERLAAGGWWKAAQQRL